jgi:hypothetical protein
MIRFRFEGVRILSESIFCDSAVMQYMDAALDADFQSLPGVSQV